MTEWIKHNGGKCPVHPDTIVRIPGGTYAADYFTFRAGDREWDEQYVRHVRDDIQHYQIVKEVERKPFLWNFCEFFKSSQSNRNKKKAI